MVDIKKVPTIVVVVMSGSQKGKRGIHSSSSVCSSVLFRFRDSYRFALFVCFFCHRFSRLVTAKKKKPWETHALRGVSSRVFQEAYDLLLTSCRGSGNAEMALLFLKVR